MARLLVIEDDEGVRAGLVRLLKAKGHEVSEAGSRMACAFALLAARYDAVITDLSVPGFLDLDVLQAVRERDKDVPIIVVSGSATVDRAIGAMELGVFRFLTKPYDGRVLLETIARASASRGATPAAQPAETAANTRPADWFDRGLDKIWLAVQPIVNHHTGRPIAYEALLRGGVTDFERPDQILFSALAEVRFPELTQVIRSRACDLIADLPRDCSLFVNLHPLELLDDSLLDPKGLAAHAPRIVLEITERASLSDVPDAQRRIQALRAAGFRMAIDDLGAGYSGLSAVTDFDPEWVKLDMALVRDVWRSAVKKSVVRAMVEMSAELGIGLIAEGVETEQERAALVELGVLHMQGYLFGRPERQFASIDLATLAS